MTSYYVAVIKALLGLKYTCTSGSLLFSPGIGGRAGWTGCLFGTYSDKDTQQQL